MTTFIDELSAQITLKRDKLRERYHSGEWRATEALRALVRRHWHAAPVQRLRAGRRPAYAIDGSNRRANLANGSTLFVAQALLVGENLVTTTADVEILPGTIESTKLERFSDLMRQNLEIRLAKEGAQTIPPGSILYLDGALYGTLAQLFPLEGVQRDFAGDLLASYRDLFATCRDRNILLISIAKTNRQPLFSEILQKAAQMDPPEPISDSAFFGEWTGYEAGYCTPILLGERSFSGGDRSVVLEQANLKTAPAIVSFFLRFADDEDPLRIDVPAFSIGRHECLGDLEEEIIDAASVGPIVELLMDDYGGIQVYNALAYVVDREVRLSRQKMYEIYLPMVADLLGERVRLDRSERRFVD